MKPLLPSKGGLKAFKKIRGELCDISMSSQPIHGLSDKVYNNISDMNAAIISAIVYEYTEWGQLERGWAQKRWEKEVIKTRKYAASQEKKGNLPWWEVFIR